MDYEDQSDFDNTKMTEGTQKIPWLINVENHHGYRDRKFGFANDFKSVTLKLKS